MTTPLSQVEARSLESKGSIRERTHIMSQIVRDVAHQRGLSFINLMPAKPQLSPHSPKLSEVIDPLKVVNMARLIVSLVGELDGKVERGIS